MINRDNYPNAYKEVYVILKNMDDKEIKEIPITVITKIKEKMNDNYNFELDLNKELKDQVLLKETKVILAYLFLNYLETVNQKEFINKKFSNDILKKEKNKGMFSGDLFERNRNEEEKVEIKQNQITEYKKEKLLIKIYNFLKKIFKH